MGRRGPPQWPPRAGLSLGPLAGSFLLGHSALRHNASGHFSAPWRATGGEVFPFPLDQVMRTNAAEVTFIPLKTEAERGREAEGRGEQRAKGGAQRWGGEREVENTGDSAREEETRGEHGLGKGGCGGGGWGHQGYTGPGGLLETRHPLRAVQGSEGVQRGGASWASSPDAGPGHLQGCCHLNSLYRTRQPPTGWCILRSPGPARSLYLFP